MQASRNVFGIAIEGTLKIVGVLRAGIIQFETYFPSFCLSLRLISNGD